MPRASADWIGPLLLVFALRAVVPAGNAPESPAEQQYGTITAATALTEALREAVASGQSEPPPPATACQARFESLVARSALSLSVPLAPAAALIVTVPDPIETAAASVFDGALEAVVSGMSSLGYVRDRFELPWAAPDKPKQSCPGMMLFRSASAPASSATPAALAVFVVGESSVWGLDEERFRNTLGLINLGGSELRILGPYYSATAAKLSAQLARLEPAPARVRIASGSLTGQDETKALKSTPRVVFRSFATPTNKRRDAALAFLGHAGNEPTIAVLQEAGTVYGQLQSAAAPAATGTAAARPGGAEVKKPLAVLLPVSYPPNVSALRDAYAALESRVSAGKVDALTGKISRTELPVGQDLREPARDVLPVLAPQNAVVVHDLALRDAVATLAHRRIGDAIVTGVLPQDVVFLVQRLKRGMPDLRVVLYNMDRLLTHSTYASDLRGALVVTPYPLHEGQSVLRTTLSRDTAEGIYHATRSLLLGIGAPPEPEPGLTLGVISHGRLWPLRRDAQDGKDDGKDDALRVPGTFLFASIAALVLSLLNLILMLHIQWTDEAESAPAAASHEDAPREGGHKPKPKPPSRIARWILSLDHEAVGRSNAWFLAGLRSCRDPLVAPWHVLMVCASQAALSALLFVLAFTWVLVAGQPADLVHGVAYVALTAAFGILACGLLLIVFKHVYVAIGVMRESLPDGTAADEIDLVARARFWACCLSLPLAVGIAGVTLLTCCGLMMIEPLQRSIFLERALELGSGVSPLTIVLSALVFMYCMALTHAARLRILDVGEALVEHQPKRYVLFRTTDNGPELLRRERALYEAALLPGGIRYLVGVGVSLGLPMLIVFYVRPSAWYRVHDFTLESGCLSLALATAMALCLGATVLTTLQVLRVFRHMVEVLSALEASDLARAFSRVPDALQRSVAEQLAHGPQDFEELRVVLRGLPQSAAASVSAYPSGVRTSLPQTLSFTQMLTATADARVKLNAASSKKARDALTTSLAAVAAFGLVRWVKQFRFLMWLVTLGTATLIIQSSAYVFSVRHLLLTMFAVLTLLAVVAGATVFAGLERDPVLSHIGGTAPGKITLQGNLLRVLGWGVLPVILAVASYYPDATRSLTTWLSTFGAP